MLLMHPEVRSETQTRAELLYANVWTVILEKTKAPCIILVFSSWFCSRVAGHRAGAWRLHPVHPGKWKWPGQLTR